MEETTYSRIQALKQLKGIKTDKEIEAKAHLSNGTLQSIKKGRQVRNTTLAAIADVLDSTVDYLIGCVAPPSDEATERAVLYAQFFNGLSRLNERNRKKVLDYIEDLLQAQQAP